MGEQKFSQVVDADGHVLEPGDMYQNYIDPQYRDRAIRIEVDAKGHENLIIDNKPYRAFSQGFAQQRARVRQRARQLDGEPAGADVFVNFKHLRKTKHTHHPVDDARGNAEALLAMKEQLGLKISWT